MNLSEIREWVVEASGRYDLVEPSNKNISANRYINAACRWLDRLTEHTKEIGRVFRTIGAGDFLVSFQHCRALMRVGISDESNFQGWLTRYTLDELKSKPNYTTPFSDVTRGTPVDFAPGYFNLVDTDSDDYSGFTDWITTISDWKTYNGIILMPPADKDYLVDIWGKFYSETLINDDDTNFWSEAEPQILVKAVMRELEVFHRNRAGQEDWEVAIRDELFGAEKDYVEHTVGDADQMEG